MSMKAKGKKMSFKCYHTVTRQVLYVIESTQLFANQAASTLMLANTREFLALGVSITEQVFLT